MSTDTYTYLEVKDQKGKWEIFDQCIFPIYNESLHSKYGTHTSTPFEYQSYSIREILCGFGNRTTFTPVSISRGLPSGHESVEQLTWSSDIEFVSRYNEFFLEGYGHTWILLSELLEMEQKYDQIIQITDENLSDKPGYVPDSESLRDYLDGRYFSDLEILKSLPHNPEDIRIIFAFHC